MHIFSVKHNYLNANIISSWASLVTQTVKNQPAMQGTWVRSLSWKDPWRRTQQPTPVFLPGEPPWREEPGGLQSMEVQRVGHDWTTKHTCMVSSCIMRFLNPCSLKYIYIYVYIEEKKFCAKKLLETQKALRSLGITFYSEQILSLSLPI